jgi:hypothetical protein
MPRYSRYTLADDWRPPEKMMRDAPLLDDYELVTEGEDLHIRGIVYGSRDPRMPEGAEVTTAVIQIADEHEGYAITYSGAWKLGAPRNGDGT